MSMSTYKCSWSFTDKAGKRHSSGDKIDSGAYDKLTLSEQTNYKRQDDEADRMAHNLMMGDMLGTGIPGGLDGNFGTPF